MAEVSISRSGRFVGSGFLRDNETYTFGIGTPDLWSSTHPALYDVEVTYGDDKVHSYMGFRSIEKHKIKGVARPVLNGEFKFQMGILDQGYWPDGIYTAPSEEAMRYDIEVLKKAGFNMLRKHMKVEPALFYRACDELGILVIQDMPSMQPDRLMTEEEKT